MNDSNIDTVISTIHSQQQKIKTDIMKIIPNDLKIVAKNDSQKKLIESIKNNEITICEGPAGCGKTFVALGYALNLLRKSNTKYTRIYLVKSVTTLKGEEIGYLKGDWKEKVEPFMWSFYINMEKLMLNTTINSLVDKDIVKPFPLAYMRGASLDNCIIIVDEAQNISLDNSRTLMTRIGSDSKIILLGDTNQIDLKNKSESSLSQLIDLFKEVEGIGCVSMSNNDTNVRNPIISVIEDKFKELYNVKFNNKHYKSTIN